MTRLFDLIYFTKFKAKAGIEMNKNITTSSYKKTITGIIIAVIVLVVVVLVNYTSNVQKVKEIEEEIFLLPSQKFEASEIEDLKAKIDDWADRPLSKDAKAVLYGRLSYFASQEGDWLGYYTNYGKEQYYLEAGEDYEAEINSLCDILF